MALQHFYFKTANRSYKLSAAELNNQVVVVPPGITLSKAATTHNPTGLPIPNPAPSAVEAGTAGSLTGVYLYAVRCVDTTTGTYSAPSSTVQVTATSNMVSLVFASLTNTTSNSRVNALDIGRTLAGGNVLFWAKRVAHTATSWVDSLSDARISANDTFKVANQAYRQLPQDTYRGILAHMERLFVWGNPAFKGDTDVTNSIGRFRGSPRALTGAAGLVPGSPVFAATVQAAGGVTAATQKQALIPGATVYDGKGNQIRWCEKDNPDAWPTNNIADIGGPEELRSAAAMGSDIYWFKRDSVWRHSYGTDPDHNTGDGSIYDMEVGRGACTEKSVVNVDGSLFCFDPKGIYQYRGGQSVFELAEAIQPLWERINWDHEAQISGAYDEERVYWFVPLDGESECRYAFVFDRLALESGRGVRWWLYHIPAGVRDASSGYVGNDADSTSFGLAGRRVCAIITAAGYEFILANVHRDGVHPELAATGTTSTAASTVFGSAGPFLSGNNDVLGCPVVFKHDRFPGTYIIQSCAAGNFVLAGGSLGSTVPAGTSFVIGGITSWWRSRYFAAEGPHDKKTGYDLDIEFFPVGKNTQINAWVAGDRMANVLNARSSEHTGHAHRKYDDTILVDMGGKLQSHGRTGFASIPMHTYDYGYLQIGVGASNVDTLYHITAFAVVEKRKRTNR